MRLIKNPIHKHRVVNLIRSMKVHIKRPRYLDTNSVSYGRAIEKLREDVVAIMKTTMEGFLQQNRARVPDMTRWFAIRVEKFISGNYFVDKQALQEWLSIRMFENTLWHVVEMFRSVKLKPDGNDCIVTTWVKEFMEALPP